MSSLFSFGDGTSGASAEESGTSAAPASTSPPATSSSITQEAERAIAAARGKRGRKSREDIEREIVAKQEEVFKQFAQLYEPENWKGLVSAPADMMLLISKRDLWKLSENEKNTLAVSAASCAQIFARTDPKWLAISMFALAFVQAYGARAAVHWNQVRREEEEKKKQTPA